MTHSDAHHRLAHPNLIAEPTSDRSREIWSAATPHLLLVSMSPSSDLRSARGLLIENARAALDLYE